jgi:hypothetical protein
MPVGPVARNDATAPFFDATARGEFLIRRCAVCDTAATPLAEQCPTCTSTGLTWEPASGGAKVVSWTVFHEASSGEQPASETVLVIAELDEGPWWWTLLLDVDADTVHEGQRIHLEFERSGDHEAVPVFRPD